MGQGLGQRTKTILLAGSLSVAFSVGVVIGRLSPRQANAESVRDGLFARLLLNRADRAQTERALVRAGASTIRQLSPTQSPILGVVERSSVTIDANEPDYGGLFDWPRVQIRAGFDDNQQLLYICLSRWEMPMP
jgi:hypothetical protein